MKQTKALNTPMRRARQQPPRPPTPDAAVKPSTKRAEPDLNAKQQRFALEYLKDFNATQAAIRAGYGAKHADVTGPRLLGNVGIAAFLEERRSVILATLEADASDVLRQLTAVATSDLAQAFDVCGRLKSVHAMPEQFRRAIASIKVTKDGEVIELKLWDKNRALETLGRHLGMFVDRTETGSAGEYARMSGEQLNAELEALRAKRAARATLSAPTPVGPN